MMPMKHEWKKDEKQFYAPKNAPSQIVVPKFKFFTIKGQGNPNDPSFGHYIEVLYALSYSVKMSPKSGLEPLGYFDYTVYPLEGVWDLSDEGIKNWNGTLDKDQLVFHLMIRQPDFVTAEYAAETIARVQQKKALPLLAQARFEEIEEGRCVQMLHNGSYDNEPASFAQMQTFASDNGLQRKFHTHREIYLSDARKTAPEKLKTILRFQVDWL